MLKFWQIVHHVAAHSLLALSNGRLWAWRFHDWTAQRAWPNEPSTPERWAGLE